MNKRPVFFWSLFMLTVVMIYKSNFVMFKLVDFLDDKTNGILALRDVRNLVMDAVDDINPLKGSLWNEKYDLPKVSLKFSKNDFNHFDAVINQAQKMSPYAYYMPNEVNQPIDSEIKINGSRYKAELKLHGTNNPHFKGAKRSYSIKIRKKDGKQYPFGTRRFALVIPSQSNLIGHFTYKIAESLGAVVPKNFLVRVFINGVDQGVYHLEEKLNKTLLERNGLSGFDVVRSDDSWAHQYADNHGTMFSFDYSGLNPKYVSGKNLSQLVTVKKLLNSDDIEFIKQHVSIEKFITYDVLRYIFGDSGHMTSNDNIKFIYSTSNGRLEPFFRIENHIEKIISNPLTYSPERHVNIGMFSSNRLLTNLTKDDSYRVIRNRAIYKVLLRRDSILDQFDKLVTKQLGVLLNDTTNELPSRYFEYEVERARGYLIHNFDLLKKYLEYSRVFIEVVKTAETSHDVLIKPDSNSPIGSRVFQLMVDAEHVGKSLEVFDVSTGKTQILGVTENGDGIGVINFQPLLSGLEFSLSLDDDLEPKINAYKFVLKFGGSILDGSFVFSNNLSDRKILERDTYLAIVDESVFLQPNVPDVFELIDDKNLIIRSGDYHLAKDVVLPYGMNLTIEAGSTILLGEGVSVLVSGDLDINGIESSQVRIVAESNDKAFGSFAAVGDGQTKCNIEYLDLSGGSEAVINGKYLSGALSLYNHDTVTIKNSMIHHNHADDGLNVKNATFTIEDSLFYSNKADQIDIDTGIGTIRGNHFSQKSLNKMTEENESDNNGDGLDLSDSQVVIIDNQVEGFLDKGFSIGEKTSAIAFENKFSVNRSAITAKDESEVYIGGNVYLNNQIDIEMYQKKLFFEHPSVFSLNNDRSDLNIQKTPKSRYFKPRETVDLTLTDWSVPTAFTKLRDLQWVEYE